MKASNILIFLFCIGITFTSNAQCPNDNTFLMNATPPPNIGISTSTVNCINGGQYVTVDVVAGNTYSFSTCGNAAFDTQITVLNAVSAAFIGYNDDDCGVQSTVTWVATFTGSVNVLVDEYNCSNSGFCTDLVITCTPPVQGGTGCNTNTTICTQGVAGPFNFTAPGPQVSSCLDFFGPTYAYIVLYITQSGPLQLLINGNAGTGFLDVAIFDVPPGIDPCTASLNVGNEIACNYATASSGCNQIGTAFPCPSSIASPNVTAGDVLFIIVENWSGTSTSFTMELGAAPAAQTGPPDATIVPAGPFCNTDAPVQLTAADNGGTWTGQGVSPSGVFDPASVGPGTYTLDYVIGSMPCADSDQTTITVTNCNCLITTFSANIGACEAANSTFTVTGDFTYQDNPIVGNLIVEVTNGSGTYTQTFTPPFTDGTLYNYSIAGVPADGTPLTVTIYFTNDMSCTALINSTSPASCLCNVDIGTFSIATTGTQTGNDFVLCFGDDLTITSNGDGTDPGEATNPPGPAYTPGISWLVYSCPPTVALAPDPILTVPDDPCLLGIVSNFDLNETNDMFWMNAYPPGTFTNNTVYFLPITMYSLTNAPPIYSYVNTSMPCYETGNIYSVQYIPEITEVSVEDCVAGTVTTTVSGGEPSINASVFTGTNLLPATAVFVVGTATNGNDIVVGGLVDGDVYSYDIVDASGCPITITGVFSGAEDPAFTYPQIAYCQNEPNPSPVITGDPGGTFSSTPGLSITPGTGQINLAASTPGTYTITYQTPDPICFATSTFDLTINPQPIVGGNSEIICAGGTVTLNGTGADTYVWNNGVTNGVPFSPPATSSYTVTGTITATGCSNTATVTVTVTPVDDPSFTTTDYCVGSPSPAPMVTGTPGGTFALVGAPAGVTIDSNTGVITGGVAGASYNIEYTTNGSCPQSNIETITVNALPVVDAQDVSICSGGTTPITATGASTYVWDNGLGAGQTHNVSPVVTTVYTVTGTDVNGCVNTDNMTVNVTTTAPIDAGADVTICIGDVATLTASGGVSYMWQAPINAAGAVQNVSPIATTTYTVDGTDANGCTGTDQVTVSVSAIPTASIAGTASVCQNDAGPTITFTGANGIAPYTFTYTINGGANQTIVSVGNTATITAPTGTVGTFDYELVEVSVAGGCSQAQVGQATITVVPNPTATISGTIEVCLGDADPTITLVGADGTAPYTFTYNMNNTGDVTITSVGNTATLTVPTVAAGVFNFNLVSVSDASAAGCSQAQVGTATVTVHDLPNVFAGNDFMICEGEQALLTGSGATVYAWDQSVVNGVLFTPSATNTYMVTGTDANGCENTDDVLITVEPTPVVSFIGDNLAGCAPLTVTFSNTTPGNLDNCIWTFEDGTVLEGCGSVTTTFTTPGTYDVTLTTTSVIGCIGTTTYTDYIYVEADPIASFLTSETMISNINPEVYFENTSTGAVDYDWNFGDGSPTVHVESPIYQFPDNEPGTYDVELIAYSPLGCTDTAYATVQVSEEVIFYVPNTFTPDDDDFNPTFQPVFNSGYDPYDFTLLIFNRWGEVIFESHNADIGWDGTYGVDGALAQDGTYSWKIEFKTTASDERVVVLGHVNMIK